jgi:hypothetical protein
VQRREDRLVRASEELEAEMASVQTAMARHWPTTSGPDQPIAYAALASRGFGVPH